MTTNGRCHLKLRPTAEAAVTTDTAINAVAGVGVVLAMGGLLGFVLCRWLDDRRWARRTGGKLTLPLWLLLAGGALAQPATRGDVGGLIREIQSQRVRGPDGESTTVRDCVAFVSVGNVSGSGTNVSAEGLVITNEH